jgi:ribose transport system permease protein
VTEPQTEEQVRQDPATPPTRPAGGPATGSTATAVAPASPPKLPMLVMSVVARYNLLVLLLASIAVYGLWDKTSAIFLTTPNFRNIVGNESVLAVLTLGLLLPLIAGQFDLSVGNVAGLASIISAASYASWGFPLWAGVLVGIAVGGFVGMVNGLIITRLRVDPFITTLGTASIVIGVVEWYTNGLSIVQGVPASLISFGSGNWLGVPSTLYALVLVALVVYYVLDHTPYGRSLNAIGVNRDAARLVGIKVNRAILISFIVSGVGAGIAGVLLLARSGAGNPQVGSSFTLLAIASAFLGATSFRPGRVNVPGTLVAIFFLAVNITGLTFAGVPNYINDLFTGAALVLAVAFATVLSRRRRVRATAGEPTSDPTTA